MPRGNRQYWKRKIARNIARGRLVTRLLRTRGWRVLRIWGHALVSPDAVACRISSNLNAAQKKRNNSHRQK
jgi:G:T-mismatch repair DNA endonuclease (very short patch repair protein)